jgi:hypothetical protein
MGLIVMSDLLCFDFVVLPMGANETDIDHLKLVLHGHDQSIRISLNVEYDAIVAQNARCTVRSLDVLRASPVGSPGLCCAETPTRAAART